jgi:hypothetical protein
MSDRVLGEADPGWFGEGVVLVLVGGSLHYVVSGWLGVASWFRG